MSFCREDYIKKIIHQLSVLQTEIANANGAKYFDINRSAESFYMGLLNRAYGYELVNANINKTKEAEGIDLIDTVNKLAVQVTSDKTSQKIKHTIDTFLKYRDDAKEYSLIIFYISGTSRRNDITFKTDESREFYLSKTKEMSNSDIFEHLKDENVVSLDRVKDVWNYICTECGDDNPDYFFSSLYKTDIFKENWNTPLFLDKENDVTFAKLYPKLKKSILPAFKEKNTDDCPIHDDLSEYLTLPSMLGDGGVIIGAPGIGKSTVISWFCNAYSEREILAYSFSDVFDETRGVSSKYKRADFLYILERAEIHQKKKELDGKVLILDGLDEIANIQEINKDFQGYISYLFDECRKCNCILLITCRENYINRLEEATFKTLYLCPWNEAKILLFAKRYKEVSGKRVYRETMQNVIKNLSIFGIPFILYLILAIPIKIKDDDKLSEVYDKVFDKKSGIFYKPYDIRYRAKTTEKFEKVLDISRRIAFWMFEHNSEVLEDSFKRFPELVEDNFYQDFFKKINHTDGIVKLQFVHRSMYEYFVADFFVERIYRALRIYYKECKERGFSHIEAKENFARELAFFGKKNVIDNVAIEESLIYTFIEEKLRKKLNKLCSVNGKLNKKRQTLCYLLWEEVTLFMFEKGLLYYAYHPKNSQILIEGVPQKTGLPYDEMFFWNKCDDVKSEEVICTKNVIDLLFIVHQITEPAVKVFEYAHKQDEDIMKGRNIPNLEEQSPTEYMLGKVVQNINSLSFNYYRIKLANSDLSNMDFSELNLSDAYLRETDLSSSNLQYTNLRNVDLSYSKLNKANLSFSDLTSADISGANMSNVTMKLANLRFADLSYSMMVEANLQNADIRYANLNASSLCETNLSNADLGHSILENVDFTGANLSGVDFRDAKLSKCIFKYANINNAKFTLEYKIIKNREWQYGNNDLFAVLPDADFSYVYINEERYPKNDAIDLVYKY